MFVQQARNLNSSSHHIRSFKRNFGQVSFPGPRLARVFATCLHDVLGAVVWLFSCSYPLGHYAFVICSGIGAVIGFGLNYAFVCFPFDSCDLLRCS